MALKTFPESCPFAAVATLLERAGIEGVRDVDVCRESHVPWLWREIDGKAYTGSYIVDNDLLNVAAHAWGFSLRGDVSPREDVPAILRALGAPAMLGIARQGGGGHTVVVDWADGRWHVENMRFAHEDLIEWWCDDAELIEAMRPSAAWGHLIEGTAGDIPDLERLHWDTVEKVFPAYRKRLRMFWEDPHSQRALRQLLDEYLRGIVLEGPGLMGAIGEEGLQAALAKLQLAVYGELGKETVRFSDVYPLERLDDLLGRYEAMLYRGIRTSE